MILFILFIVMILITWILSVGLAMALLEIIIPAVICFILIIILFLREVLIGGSG